MKIQEKPKPIAVPVVLGAVIKNNDLLLINRRNPPFCGLWGMPGGKIHYGEHLDEAVRREIWEECHIKTRWVKLCGVVTENLYLDQNEIMHYLLHICQLKPISWKIESSVEGKVAWFAISRLAAYRHLMIPSDFIMLKRLVLTQPNRFYYRCEVVTKANHYQIKLFRSLDNETGINYHYL
ncbi:MAG: NUDIX domain-containing protein [candidate division WOR-3 bacterium]